jgi:hypothetical protein
MVQNRSSAVMQQRTEAHDSLDDFATPPWATRAAIEIVGRYCYLRERSVREPCANRGYMVRPLQEYFGTVIPSDVHDYGSGYPLMDYLWPHNMLAADWTFMNPPFNLAERFINMSFSTPHWTGTAAIVRTSFVEGAQRYKLLFRDRPPTLIAQFCERVIMSKGAPRDPDKLYWDGAQWKKPSTATSYAWLFWLKGIPPQPFHWIAPGTRKRLTRPGDYPADDGRQHQPDGGPHVRDSELVRSS